MHFLRQNFFIGDKPIQALIDVTGYRCKAVEGEMGTAFTGPVVCLDNHLNLRVQQESPKLCMTTINRSANKQLVTFTHEFSHIVNGLLRSVIMEPEKNKITIRRGLLLEVYDMEDRDLNPVCHNMILDEVINVFQTADMMRSICQLDRELLDDKVRDFFDKLDLSSISIPQGYESITTKFRPLWENDVFRDSIDDNIIIGDIEKIEEHFDGIVGQSKLMKFSEALDNSFFCYTKGLRKIENDFFIRKTICDYNKITGQKAIQKVKSRKFLD